MLVGILALHSFLLLSSITLYEYTTIVHFPADGCSVCFQLEAINNKNAFNIP